MRFSPQHLPRLHIVWFKRDLRIRDHVPLSMAIKAAASNGESVLLLHAFEPKDLEHSTTANRHLQFRWQAWQALKQEVNGLQWPVEVAAIETEVLESIEWLRQQYLIAGLYSHEETGLRHTYDRDIRVKAWCASNQIPWHESKQQAVRRGRASRKGWAEDWHRSMNDGLVQVIAVSEMGAMKLPEIRWPEEMVAARCPRVLHELDPGGSGPFQMGGERDAHRYMQSFYKDRVKGYRRQIGRPLESRQSCSRLSPYLAWGCLSMRQVFQAFQNASAQRAKMDLKAFGSRLRWQGHFIQKFESEDRMEFESVNRGYLTMQHEGTSDSLEAWKCGRTGVPLVDACMRCLIATGYLNFRMRAMLVSFLTHHLDHPWQSGVEHLARCFLDFEPGIHYSQFQMQAGVTGINTIRIYNPVKQGLERDPEGEFIAQWVPELRGVAVRYRHAPWTMPPLERAWQENDFDYVDPIVNVGAAAGKARERLWSRKKSAQVRKEAQRILSVHVAPNGPMD